MKQHNKAVPEQELGIGNRFGLMPWPLDRIDNGSEPPDHLLMPVLGFVLLREMENEGEIR